MDLFSQSLVVPQNLRFYLHRLADNAQPSTNILRVNALNSTSAGSGGLIIVRLPMALVDLNSFAMHFETQLTDGSNTAGSDANDAGFRGILPKGIEGLISRMEISVNGLGLLNLQQYGLLFSMLKESHLHLDKSMMRTQLQNEKDMVCQFSPTFDGVNGAADSSDEVLPFTVTNWTLSATNPLNIGRQTDAHSAFIACRTVTSQPMPCCATGTSYNLLYAPPLSYFGLTNADASGLAALPAIVSINSTKAAYTTTKGDAGTYITEFVIQYTGKGLMTFPSALSSAKQFSIFVTVAPQDIGISPRLIPNNNNFHTIHDWLAFFKAQPEWIQTQMLGEIEVRITLAGQEVLGISHPQIDFATQTAVKGWNKTALPDYSLQNIFFSIRTCSFDNNFVDDILHHKLSSGGELEIPYDNYFNINQVQTGGSSQTRFSVNTQCLNKVLGVNRVANFAALESALTVVPTGFGPTSKDRMGVVHKSPYFCTTASVPSGANYGTGVDPSMFNNWQYQINNAFIPNYKVSPVNTFFYNMEAYDMHNDWASGQCAVTPSMYLNSEYQMAVALDFMDSEIPRLMSGVDTRGAVSVAYLNQDNNNAGDRTDIFTCFSSILRVGSNQQCQVCY